MAREFRLRPGLADRSRKRRQRRNNWRAHTELCTARIPVDCLADLEGGLANVLRELDFREVRTLKRYIGDSQGKYMDLPIMAKHLPQDCCAFQSSGLKRIPDVLKEDGLFGVERACLPEDCAICGTFLTDFATESDFSRLLRPSTDGWELPIMSLLGTRKLKESIKRECCLCGMKSEQWRKGLTNR